MTRREDYNGYVISRLVAGLFGAIPQVLGNGVITNIFFRHQRGRAFTIYSTSYLLGSVAGPTFGAFIIQHVEWSVTCWWTAGLNAVILVLIFLLVEETGYHEHFNNVVPSLGENFLENRRVTFFIGNRVVSSISRPEFVGHLMDRSKHVC